MSYSERGIISETQHSVSVSHTKCGGYYVYHIHLLGFAYTVLSGVFYVSVFSDHIPTQNLAYGLFNEGSVCLLCSRNWIFKSMLPLNDIPNIRYMKHKQFERNFGWLYLAFGLNKS